MNFVVGSRICIRYRDELLIYPIEQADRRVGQVVSECLRLGGLFGKVARTILEEKKSRVRAAASRSRGVEDMIRHLGRPMGFSNNLGCSHLVLSLCSQTE